MRADENGTGFRRRTTLVVALLAALAVLGVGVATAQDLESQLSQKESKLADKEQQKGVLTTEISRYSDEIDRLAGEVAVLRNREAIVQEQLDQVKARLRREERRLDQLRHHLRRSLNALRNRLVAIYRSGEPDVLTVILSSDGFDDLVNRYEYLRRIQERDTSIVDRVRFLRNDSRNTVERIEAARDQIAAKKAELARTRGQLEARQGELDAVRDRRAAALDSVETNIQRLEGDISDIQADIQAQIQAASSTTTTPLPAGPVQGGSPGGMIWPVNGPMVSPFGPRWGRMHEGIDIAVPAGTPIRAAQSGNVILAAPTGGYGNYICVDHGGGLSSCYAHLSSYAASSGASVSQGEVIGYVGCTGHCFGDHLHFEVRINGAAVDPMGYL
jgi:murein DD-endopeptidase MepM/ murein hydrolase activator NlpD